MRLLLTWLIALGVLAGLAAHSSGAASRHAVYSHSHEHHGDHSHHPHELPVKHDGCDDSGSGGERDCPEGSHEHHHVVCCSPVVLGLERGESRLFAGFAGTHVALRVADEAPPEGPYPELDTPPLI